MQFFVVELESLSESDEEDDDEEDFDLKLIKDIIGSDFIWPFLWPYMGVIPNSKMAFIFPISYFLALVFPILIKYFPECEGKGSLKSEIKSLIGLDMQFFVVDKIEIIFLPVS